MKGKKVAILGCGPAGLLSAHAANLSGWDFEVYSVKKPSDIGGAQYLHEPVPDLTEEEPEGIVSYAKVGTARGYAAKVYGSPDAPTSWDKFPVGDLPAWTLRGSYELLRGRYWNSVVDRMVSSSTIERLVKDFDMVISTVPANKICYNSRMCKFTSQKIVIADISLSLVDNFIIYNGRPETDWYRTSSLFRYDSTEWSEARPPSLDTSINCRVGVKPLATTCTCYLHHGNFHRLGRFGQWKKGVLVSDAFEAAMSLLMEAS